MNKSFSGNIIGLIIALPLVLVFSYIFFIIQPELIFHHSQPPFLTSQIFYKQYLNYPGGPSELVANFIAQSFYYKVFGTVCVLCLFIIIAWFSTLLFDSVCKSNFNFIWSSIPAILSISLLNNYNFPLSAIVSFGISLLFLVLVSKSGKGFYSSILLFISGGVFIYGFAGSGYFSFYSLSALFISIPGKKRMGIFYIITVILFVAGFPWLVSEYLFPVSLKHQYLYFYSTKAWFMRYYPSPVFVAFILSVPLILVMVRLHLIITKKIKLNNPKLLNAGIVTSVLIVSATGFLAHQKTYDSEVKKVIKADYYSFKEDIKNTEKNAATTREYNFAANVNYNLALIKNNKLSDEFFSFMQIKGSESLHPDIDFATELSFVSSEYYYELGFISEARHWAYEALVFYPYSIRAMQNLVKIHLILGEYKAAERMLNTLDKGLLDKKFVHEFMPYILDTSLVSSNTELMEKRGFIPKEKELNRSIEGRFIELLEANNQNKPAYESLMLFYLTTARLDEFVEKYKQVDLYFEKVPAIYEEALLIYTQRTGKDLPVETNISNETQQRFKAFMNELEKYKGQTRMARNNLYADYGKSYLYFLKFVYPNVLETEIISDEEDYPEI